MSKNKLVIAHHEVGFGYVDLKEMLDTLMSYEILAKKKLQHFWDLENKALDRSGVPISEWPPLKLRLFDDVPAKPPPIDEGKGRATLTSNPLDALRGLIALHTREFRH